MSGASYWDPRCQRCWQGIRYKRARWSNGAQASVYCGCVWRRIYRDCIDRYNAIRARIALASAYPARRKNTWSYPGAEYVADIELTARRVLSPQMHRVFELRVKERVEAALAIAILRIDEGAYWHLMYAMQEKLGHAWATAEPNGLHPAQYFDATAQPQVRLPHASADAPPEAPRPQACAVLKMAA